MKRIVIILMRNGQNISGQWNKEDADCLRACYAAWLQKEAMGKSLDAVDRLYENDDEEISIDLSEVVAVLLQDPEKRGIAIPQGAMQIPRN